MTSGTEATALASFYTLPSTLLSETEQWRACCRVIAKAWQKLGSVDVLCGQALAISHLDDLLWTFHAGSFLPHGVDPSEPVYLSQSLGARRPDSRVVVLMEWDGELPPPSAQFRVIDFIPPDGSRRDQARERYRQLRQAGYSMQILHLDS